MEPLRTDLSIYRKFDFDKPPVGVKFLFLPPEGIEHIDRPLAGCEMIQEAQNRMSPFYMTKDDETCFAKMALGMIDAPAFAESGQIGERFGIFQEARANVMLYEHVPMFKRGIVNYVVFSPLDVLTFNPDVLLFYAKPHQAEVLLRAMSYSTGALRETKSTQVLGCAWLLVYPYQSGKVNFTMTGLDFGMIGHHVFSPGYLLISVPFQWIPTITDNLNEMKWVLPAYEDNREEFIAREQKLVMDLVEQSQAFK
jgi:uncharacterized protein (DUF169 family)